MEGGQPAASGSPERLGACGLNEHIGSVTVSGQIQVRKQGRSLGISALVFFFWCLPPLLSSIIEMTIDWKNQRCLKLLIRLKILWKAIFLTWFVRFSQVC